MVTRLTAVAVLTWWCCCALPRLLWLPKAAEAAPMRSIRSTPTAIISAATWPFGPPWSSWWCWRSSDKSAWGPISEGLQKRESEIAGQIAEAQRKNEEARQLLADYEKKLAAAQDEVRGLIEQGRRDAEKVGQQLLEKAREEAGIERQRAVQQIESATLAALEGTGRAQRHPGRGFGRQDRRRAAQSRGPQPADRAGGGRVLPARQGNGKSEGRTENPHERMIGYEGVSMAESADIIARDAQNAARFSPDVGQEKVGEIYARALLGAAENAGQTAAVLDELDAIVERGLCPVSQARDGPRLAPGQPRGEGRRARPRLRGAGFPAAAEFPQGRVAARPPRLPAGDPAPGPHTVRGDAGPASASA